MKIFLAFTLLMAGTGSMQAAIVETITFDLGSIHPGSILSGMFTLSNAPQVGDTAPVLLSFSDPTDYSPTSLNATISIETGTPSGFAVDVSPLTFTNLSGVTTPINTRDISITTRTPVAMCASFPCTSTGGWQDRSPVVFQGTYNITPAAVPEPGYGLLLAMSLTALVFGRLRFRPGRPGR